MGRQRAVRGKGNYARRQNYLLKQEVRQFIELCVDMVDQSEDCILLVLLSLAECTQQTICVQIGTLLHYSRSSPSFTGPSVLGDPTFKRNVTIATYLGLNCNFV